MKLNFFGAAGCVTGSSHLISVNGKKVLLDCGLYQGRDEKERGNENFDFDPKEIDFVVLSHAHIDHSGRIPLLYKKGFKGQIISTRTTMDLCSAMLPDSGHIQEMEVEWKNRKRVRQGLELLEPIYTAQIAMATMFLFKGYEYNELIELFEGFEIRFRDAGHLLGSAIVEIFIKEGSKEEVKLVYTGDLGNKNIPILRDPTIIEAADYLIMETTYGDRLHDNIDKEFKQLATIIQETFKRGGNVIIPSFAVGRTQEVLYALNQYIDSGLIKNLRVFVDSPLAAESTKIYIKHIEDYDEEALKLINKGEHPLEFDGVVFTKSPEDSANINKIQSGAIVISASGMCEAGRIKHHLKHNLWRKECSIVFVGYQAEGTLGRAIVDGTKKVKLFGEEVAVKAHIYNLHGLSGHADREGLISWVEAIKSKPKEILLVHGDKEARESFKALLSSKGFRAKAMEMGETYGINEKIEVNSSKESKLKDRLFALLDSRGDLDSISKEDLLEEIKKTIFK
ncbi:MAG: MBL fold metallo-hydrolase [Clostridiaceae bacterium]|nr:MBL fold metallo-hydrolase [Clostridiaceae bacterium]